MVCWAEGGAPANWLRPQRSTTETTGKTDTLGGTPRKKLTPTQTECGSGHKTEPFLALPETGEGDPQSGPASEGHVREEGPLSGWRPEGLGLSNRRRPRGRGGGAPCTGGRASDLSITDAGGNTYHTKEPRRDPAGAGRPRRGAGPGWREPIRRAAPGGEGGVTARDPNTRVRAHREAALLLRLPLRRPENLPPSWTTPPLWPRPSPPPPLLRRGERGDGCWEARAAPPSPPRPPLTRHPFLLLR
ncbi:uncharacterized protein [Vicugna pacos]|uniref:Uncharacterized protein n=1 Tax=Vicugna pacos TaxID=30538 RepID=A0ABM5DIX3_VICPA